jgi:hypothetical protein
MLARHPAERMAADEALNKVLSPSSCKCKPPGDFRQEGPFNVIMF